MNDDNEFEDDVDLGDTFDDDFEKKNQTLGDMWRDNPVFKIGSVIAVVVVIFLIISFLGGGDDDAANTSYVDAAPTVNTAPGTDKASPAYIEAIEEQNEADVEYAQSTGGSALPVPIEPPVGLISVPEEQGEGEDPLQRWRRLQEERLQTEIAQREALAANVDTGQANAEAINSLASLMSEQMSSILGTKSEVGVSSLSMTDSSFIDYLASRRDGGNGAGADGSGGGDSDDGLEEEVIQELLLNAGEIVYAQLLIEANSDVPGPVLAQIVSGPFSGMRILGSFTVEEEYLVLDFNTLVYGDETIGVSAVALDPETTLPGMATEVDHRYFRRVVLPAAAAFVEGMADAIEESGRTSITVTNSTTTSTEESDTDDKQEVASGISEVGSEVREILDEMGDVEALVRIEAGTPIGILFVEPVVTQDETL